MHNKVSYTQRMDSSRLVVVQTDASFATVSRTIDIIPIARDAYQSAFGESCPRVNHPITVFSIVGCDLHKSTLL
jgi:hypothetical protein